MPSFRCSVCPVRLPTHCVSIDRVSIRGGPWLKRAISAQDCVWREKGRISHLDSCCLCINGDCADPGTPLSHSFDISQCSGQGCFEARASAHFKITSTFSSPTFKIPGLREDV